jgi:hypothetical protein
MTARQGVHCMDCNVVVDTRHAGAAELVRGFRVNRSGGGANQILAWEGLGMWLCPSCVSLRRAGVDPTQLAFGSADVPF